MTRADLPVLILADEPPLASMLAAGAGAAVTVVKTLGDADERSSSRRTT